MSVLLCFMHPYSCMPKVHTGFNICLYSISLLCIDRADLLPMSQYIFLYFSPSSSRFFLTRAYKRSLASGVMPRHFAVFEWGMTLSFIVIGVCWHLVLVKSACTDLTAFSLTDHFLVQLFTLSTARCNFSVTSLTLSPTAIIALSSAKVVTVASSGCGRSLLYSSYRIGHNTLPAALHP